MSFVSSFQADRLVAVIAEQIAGEKSATVRAVETWAGSLPLGQENEELSIAFSNEQQEGSNELLLMQPGQIHVISDGEDCSPIKNPSSSYDDRSCLAKITRTVSRPHSC